MKYALLFTALLAVAIGFNVWLGSGCEMDSGAITWHGKVCVWGK